MKNVFMRIGIYQDTFGCHLSLMNESIIDGHRIAFMMDCSGQHSIKFEKDVYGLTYLGSVEVNDAKSVLRLLIELDLLVSCHSDHDLKTYVWGFKLLSPVKSLTKKLELWKQ